jgi:hypothetical protein
MERRLATLCRLGFVEAFRDVVLMLAGKRMPVLWLSHEPQISDDGNRKHNQQRRQSKGLYQITSVHFVSPVPPRGFNWLSDWPFPRSFD